MGASRRNRPIFRFIRTFDINLFGNLVAGSRRLKRVELVSIAQSRLGAEFWRLVALFRSKRILKVVFRRSELLKKKQFWQKRDNFVYLSNNEKLASILKHSRARKLRLFLSPIRAKKRFIINNAAGVWAGSGWGGTLGRSVTGEVDLVDLVDVARALTRVLLFCVGEPKLCSWAAGQFPGFIAGLLVILSPEWRFFLLSLLRKSGTCGSFFKLSVRSPRVRRLFLNKQIPSWRKDEKSTGSKSALKVSTGGRGFLVRKSSRSRGVGAVLGEEDLGRFNLFEDRQIIRRFLGNLTLRQLWQYRKRASTRIKGLWERYSLGLFECRLDVFLVRTGFVGDLLEARRFVRSGFVLVNGKVLNYYRYVVAEGDVLQLLTDNLREFQIKYINSLWDALHEGEGVTYRSFPVYLEMAFRKMAVCSVIGKTTPLSFIQNVHFNTAYSVNCGRFQF